MLQAKGQLHGGAQRVLPRHKNADCKRCVKESGSRKKKKKSGITSLTVYSPGRLAREEGGSNGDNNGEEASKVTLAKGEDNPGSGDWNSESDN
jgi:hypothetical protein